MAETLFERLYNLHRAAISSNSDSDENTSKKEINETIQLFREASNNPLFNTVWSNPKTTFFETIETIRRRKYSSWRKYMPHKKDREHDKQVEHGMQLFPNIQHLKTPEQGIYFPDNPITGIIEGIPVGITIQLSELFKLTNFESLMEGAAIGLVTGLSLNLWSRNRNHFKGNGREDFENARYWDTTQYLDMINYFLRKNPDTLGKLESQVYAAPRYLSLTDKQRTKAYNNLVTNPFIQGVKVSIGFDASNFKKSLNQS